MKKSILLFCFIAGLTSLSAQTLIQKFYFDFGKAADSTKFDAVGNNGNYWNNYTGVSTTLVQGFQTRKLINSSNAVSNYNLFQRNIGNNLNTFVGVNGPSFGPNTNTVALGDLGIANATTSTIYNNSAGGTGAVLAFKGLNPAKRYKFYIFGSRAATARVNRYTLTGTTSYTDTLTIGYAAANANTGNASGAGVTYNNTRIVQSGLIYPKADSITLAATMVSGTFGVYINCMKMEEYKGTQTITFGALTTKAIGDVDYSPGATASSGLTVRYESSNLDVAKIVDGKIQIVGVGNTTITAFQDGDPTYEAATNEAQILNVSASLTAQTITFDPLPAKTCGDAAFQLTASASSGLTVSFASSNQAVATVLGSTVTIVGGGTTDITASQSGDGTYAAASNVIQTLTVNKLNQTITFEALSSKTDADAPFTVSPSSTSGLAVALTSSNTAVALVSGSTITIVGAGTSTITASQAGNTIYNAAATSVPQALIVSSVMSANQNLLFDFGPIEGINGDATTNPDTNGNYWNNISNAAGGTGWSTTYPAFTDLINSGNTKNIGFTLAFTANGFTANGKLNGGLLTPFASQFGSNSELAIATATEDYIFTGNTSNGPVIKFSGLNSSRKYKFKIFGSRNTNIDRAAQYTLQGAGSPSVGTFQSSTVTGLGGTVYIGQLVNYPTNLNVLYALTPTDTLTKAVTFYGNNSIVYTSGLVQPDGTGAITLTTITTTPSSAFAYINCMKIEEYADNRITAEIRPIVDEIKVYPTNFSNQIAVEGAFSSIEIYNALGTLVKKQKATNKTIINTSQLGKGIYVLVVDGNKSYKLIK